MSRTPTFVKPGETKKGPLSMRPKTCTKLITPVAGIFADKSNISTCDPPFGSEINPINSTTAFDADAEP